MLELKYFKELPCRSLNANTKYIQLAGADLYTDKEGNHFAFLSIKNNHSKPCFSLYLYIKEYDSSGTFLKENKFSMPTYYAERGIHIINEPIPLENGCDGIEVFVYLAEYVGYNFYNDKFTRIGEEQINLSLSTIKTQAKTVNNSVKQSVVKPTVSSDSEEPVYDEPEMDKINDVAQFDTSSNDATVTTKPRIFNFISVLCPIASGITIFIIVNLIMQFFNNLI